MKIPSEDILKIILRIVGVWGLATLEIFRMQSQNAGTEFYAVIVGIVFIAAGEVPAMWLSPTPPSVEKPPVS